MQQVKKLFRYSEIEDNGKLDKLKITELLTGHCLLAV